MSDVGFLDSLPLWALFAITVVIIYSSIEGGYRFGKYRHRGNPEKDAPVGAIVGAILGLLAFMLAFTFSLAATRFEVRRQSVLDEANAIGTTFLRAGMLPEPHGTKIRDLLREYADVRIHGVREGNLDDALKRSGELHNELWTQAEIVAKIDKSPITAVFIQSLNEVIDLHATRVQAGLRSRIPGIIWQTLFFVAIVGMAGVGYQMGLADSRRSWAIWALVLTFASVYLLIADLDRSREGWLRVSQQPLIDAAESMRNPPPKP